MSPPSRRTVDAHVYPSTALAEPGDMAQALVRHARGSGYAKQLYVILDRGHVSGGQRERLRTWWIAPNRRQPIYRYGKIMVTSRHAKAPQGGGPPARRGAATLFVGLCMQKGLDPRAAEALPAARRGQAWVMTAQPRWVWEDFVPEMAAGYIDPLAAKAEEAGGSPLSVVLEARDLEGEDRYETIAFEWTHGEMTPLSSPHRRARGHLREFSSAGTLATLARRLRYAPQCDGLWLELAIGFQLWASRTGPGAAIWDEHRIWESACRPWSLWLR
jgi:hypothetical protein